MRACGGQKREWRWEARAALAGPAMHQLVSAVGGTPEPMDTQSDTGRGARQEVVAGADPEASG